jgi:hypothetical protein
VTPTERLRWARIQRTRTLAALADARDAVDEAADELHLARFVATATEEECPTCGASADAYCAIWQRNDGTYSRTRSGESWPADRLLALFLHRSRTTTPAALAAAAFP